MISRLERAAAIAAALALPLVVFGAGPQEPAVLVGYGPHGEAIHDCLVPAGTVLVVPGRVQPFALRSSKRNVVGQVSSISSAAVIFEASSSINADGTKDQTRFVRLTYPATRDSKGTVLARPGYECAHDAEDRSPGAVQAIPFSGR